MKKLKYFKYISLLAVGVLPVKKSQSFTDESREKIAIIDTGISEKLFDKYLCKDGLKDFTDTGIADTTGHGDNITGIIVHSIDPKRQCLMILKWINPSTAPGTANAISRAVNYATANGVKYINLSAGGSEDSRAEEDSIRSALAAGAIVVVAAGNRNQDLSENCNFFPACYDIRHPNFHVVANYRGTKRQDDSNYNGPVTDKADGHMIDGHSGTSQSTAIITGNLIKR